MVLIERLGAVTNVPFQLLLMIRDVGVFVRFFCTFPDLLELFSDVFEILPLVQTADPRVEFVRIQLLFWYDLIRRSDFLHEDLRVVFQID